MVKISAFLELEPRLNIKFEFNWAGKNENFSKVSCYTGLQRIIFPFSEKTRHIYQQ